MYHFVDEDFVRLLFVPSLRQQSNQITVLLQCAYNNVIILLSKLTAQITTLWCKFCTHVNCEKVSY